MRIVWALSAALVFGLAGCASNMPPALPDTGTLTVGVSGSGAGIGRVMLDVRIEKHFETGRGSNVAFFGDILNLTNSSSYEDIVTRLGTASNFGVPTRFIYPRRLMLGAKFRF